MAELSLESLSKTFGDQTVVRDLSLTIPEGAFTALLGPSGCGKTTTLRILAGLERLSSGRLTLGNRLLADAVTHLPPEARNMGMVFQSYALWPHMTVAENVGYPLKLKKVNGAARHKQVLAALEVVELAAYADRAPQDLSGGQRQRVALARCLVREQPVLLLDEPFSALDPALRQEMLTLVSDVCQRQHLTLLMVSHSVEDAARIAPRSLVVADGRIAWDGATETLLSGNSSASHLLGISAR